MRSKPIKIKPVLPWRRRVQVQAQEAEWARMRAEILDLQQQAEANYQRAAASVYREIGEYWTKQMRSLAPPSLEP